MKADKTIFKKAFKESDKILSQANGQIIENHRTNINWSDIQTILIKKAGLLCENYASDIIIDIDSIKAILDNIRDLTEPVISIAGIRESGVDHDEFVLSQINSYESNYHTGYTKLYYRAILAVEITPIFDEDNKLSNCCLILKDIREELGSEIYRLAQNNMFARN